MRKDFVLPLLLAFFLHGISHADTNVSGNITTDTTWTRANSPYLITETIEVLPGATLTIEPGVIVKSNKRAELLIGGELIAAGTEDQMIVFTSNESVPQPFDWEFKFLEGAKESILNESGEYVSGSIIEHCQVEYSGGITSSVALYIGYSNVINNRGGISISSYFPDVKPERVMCLIRGNTIADSGGRGIDISYSYGDFEGISFNFAFISNSIMNNSGDAISLGLEDGSLDITVVGNLIGNNEAGISVQSGNTTALFSQNTITGNNGQAISVGVPLWHGCSFQDLTISHNIISDNHDGITLPYDCMYVPNSVDIHGNTISDNLESGIAVNSAGTYTFSENNIENNGAYGIVNNPPSDTVATNNWWGTTNTSEIQELIYDFNDDASLGKVILEPVAQSPFPRPEIPPVAAFTVSPSSGVIPLTVSFADGSSGSPTSWLWDFGDGTTSAAQNPRHIYESPGRYGVTLTVSNAYGSDTEIKTNYLSVQQNCGDYNADGYVNKDDFIKRRDYLTYQMETVRQDFVDWFFQCWLPNQRSPGTHEDDQNKAMQEALDDADEKAKEAVDHAEELFQE